MIRITANRQQGMWRAGMFHPHQSVDHSDDAFTEEQLEALEGEGMLTLQRIEGDPENAPPADAPGAHEAGEIEQLKEQLGQREAAVAGRENALQGREEKAQEREDAIAERERKFQALRDRPLVREGILKAAIEKVVELKQDVDFTKEGEPKTEAVEREAPGMDITAAERSQWFAELYPAE